MACHCRRQGTFRNVSLLLRGGGGGGEDEEVTWDGGGGEEELLPPDCAAAGAASPLDAPAGAGPCPLGEPGRLLRDAAAWGCWRWRKKPKVLSEAVVLYNSKIIWLNFLTFFSTRNSLPFDDLLLVPPYRRVEDRHVLVSVLAALLEGPNAVCAVVLQVAHRGVHRVGGAGAAEAPKGEVVVQDQHALWFGKRERRCMIRRFGMFFCLCLLSPGSWKHLTYWPGLV